MAPHELTSDEQYLRWYYLQSDEAFKRLAIGEVVYVLPALLIAALSLRDDSGAALWLAFAYLLGLYAWRCWSKRWTRATRSLFQKYEAALGGASREQSTLVDV